MLEPPDDILDLLRCPVTGSKLERAEPSLLARLNASIAAGEALTRLSDVVEEPVSAGLINIDRTLLYPIERGTIVLLAGDAIEVWELRDSA